MKYSIWWDGMGLTAWSWIASLLFFFLFEWLFKLLCFQNAIHPTRILLWIINTLFPFLSLVFLRKTNVLILPFSSRHASFRLVDLMALPRKLNAESSEMWNENALNEMTCSLRCPACEFLYSLCLNCILYF